MYTLDNYKNGFTTTLLLCTCVGIHPGRVESASPQTRDFHPVLPPLYVAEGSRSGEGLQVCLDRGFPCLQLATQHILYSHLRPSHERRRGVLAFEKKPGYVFSECEVRSIEAEPSGSRIYHPASPHRAPEVFFFPLPPQILPFDTLLPRLCLANLD